MAAETAMDDTKVYRKILCEFREAVNGCIRNISMTPGILENSGRPSTSRRRAKVKTWTWRIWDLEVDVFCKQICIFLTRAATPFSASSLNSSSNRSVTIPSFHLCTFRR